MSAARASEAEAGASWRLVFLVNVPIGLAALVVGRRMPQPPMRPVVSRPDLGGSLLAVDAVGVLALGAVQDPVWGWGDPRTLAAFAGSALLTPLLWRSAVHPAPVLELPLFRVRSFSAGKLGALLLGTRFFGLVLASSLYLTQGLLRVARAARDRARAAGQRARGRVAGDPRGGPERAFLSEWLPATLLMGTGVGLGFATIVAVYVRDLGAGQLGIGSGMSSTTRQLGTVLAVAVLIAMLGPAPGSDSYDSGWWAMAGLALLAVVPVVLIGRRPGVAAM